MAKKTAREPLPFKKAGKRRSLIEWDDTSKQAHVLDWRQRAHEFGLVPVNESADADAGDMVVMDPERLLYEEEPEAFREQSIRDDGGTEEEDVEQDTPGGRVSSREDVDLVRVYLQHIGK